MCSFKKHWNKCRKDNAKWSQEDFPPTNCHPYDILGEKDVLQMIILWNNRCLLMGAWFSQVHFYLCPICAPAPLFVPCGPSVPQRTTRYPKGHASRKRNSLEHARYKSRRTTRNARSHFSDGKNIALSKPARRGPTEIYATIFPKQKNSLEHAR